MACLRKDSQAHAQGVKTVIGSSRRLGHKQMLLQKNGDGRDSESVLGGLLGGRRALGPTLDLKAILERLVA